MKSTGIVRKVDELGRIVLPVELRKKLNINIKDPLEIFTSNDRIVLQKYEPADVFTGEMDDLIEYKGKKVSKKSICELAEIAGFEIIAKTGGNNLSFDARSSATDIIDDKEDDDL